MRKSGPWDEARIDRHLRDSLVPLRLGCVDGSGFPVVVSLWYQLEDGALWCATPTASWVARWLAREPRCAFEVAPDQPPYSGVRGQGFATLLPDAGPRVLRQLALRYLGSDTSAFARWLLSREVPEVAIRIAPARVASWDFSGRMSDG